MRTAVRAQTSSTTGPEAGAAGGGAVMEAVYRVDGDRVVVSRHAAGPWDSRMQHGAAPSSLAVWAAERIATAVPMRIARVTVDLMRPVPLLPLTLETDVVREGRKIQLCTVRLKADGVVVAAANVLKVRCEDQPLPADVPEPLIDLPGPEASREEPGWRSTRSFVSGMSVRAARGRFGEPGPGAAWFRVERPLIEGSPVSQAMRAVVAADFANGTAAALDFHQWTFINADLTVSMARQPVGDWILLDGETWLGRDGAGLSMARLGDERGYFGRAVQSLVIERRRPGSIDRGAAVS